MAPVSATPFLSTLYTRVRLATPEDVPHIHKLIYKMADYYHLADTFEATESSLSAHLFKSPPFQSFTTFLAEVSTKPLPRIESPHFTPVERVVQIDRPVIDPDAETFKSTSGGDAVVVGFTLIFPNFSTFMGKPGFHLEDLFIREGHRGFGMGKLLLSAVASQTVKMGYGRVEWTVIDWNVRSHKFYERLGAKVLPDWRICRLSEENLEAYGDAKCHFNFDLN
ncbi:probable acetyltransferase NATA1-like [Ricinus communis]|uniref:Tyramine N-feruloyltransferase 4/11, putative n=1 Tax=Ricinus communis TaxID=3988 RepID=B9SY56_RICCO|nr:probable acetyltransferase NATA1-like [Ricinus communis]EEF31440.1 Tyramine N-feruloyltransferase 4/11, putative [Ricinus communis]|eukprot:XP_002530925.1 probable acetyltransferase NATA1-like [Ricinus communis]